MPVLLAMLWCLVAVPCRAQQPSVSGRITDRDEGTPVAGAVVAVEGTTAGTTTDRDGRYTLPLAPGVSTLRASCLGYKTQTIVLNPGSGPATADFALEPQSYGLETVVVTGTGTEHLLKDAPVQTEVISGQALKAYAGGSLSDILAGLSPSFDFSPSDMGSGISMNGLGNAYILILVDGKRMHGDVGGQNDLSAIDPSDVERIEIVKGASSSLYGSDAIAGVINIITRKQRDLPLTLLNTTRLGSYFDVRQSDRIDLRAGRWKFSTRFSMQHSDGWRNTRRELYRDSLYENSSSMTVSAFTNYRISQRAEYRHSDALTLYAEGMFYKKNIYHPLGKPQLYAYDLFYIDHAWSGGVKWKASERSLLTLDLDYDAHLYNYRYKLKYIDEYYRDELLPDGSILSVPVHTVYYPGDTSRESDQNRLVAHAKGVFDLCGSNRLSAGAEFLHEWLIAPARMRQDRASAWTLSAYAQDEWDITPRLNLTAGVRLVGHKEFGTEATPKASLRYKLGGFNLRATYARGFKTPTLKELYYQYRRTMMSLMRLYLGNTDLRPQTSDYFSAGAEYNDKVFSASVTGYFNRVRNMIALIEVPVPDQWRGGEETEIDKAMQYTNMERARIGGADFVFSARLGRSVTLGGGYSYVDAHADLFNEETGRLERRIVDGTARHRANLNGTWSRSWRGYKLTVGLFGKIQSKRYYYEYGDADGYMTWRLNTTHTIGSWKRWRLELTAGIDNLFDYKETKPLGYNYATKTPGRTYYGAVTVRFTTDKSQNPTKKQ